jgi:hypothetical protein
MTAKAQTIEYLHEVYEALGDTEKMNEYARLLAQYPHAKEAFAPVTSELTALFNNYIQEKQEADTLLQKRQTQRQNLLIGAIILLVILALGLVLWATHKRHKQTEADLREEHQQQQEAFDQQREAFNQQLSEAQTALKEKTFDDLLKEVKNNLTDFEVTVPFDESLGEKFEYSIEDNKLTVKVSFEDENMVRCNSTTVNIPQNCDVEKLSKRYNNLAKTMTVIIPKTIVEPSAEAKKEEEEKPTTGFKLNKTATTPKTTKKEETPEEHQASSKLLKKFKENTVRRAANGRFVKRTAPTE